MIRVYSWWERWARLRCRVLGHRIGEHPHRALLTCCLRCGEGVPTEFGKAVYRTCTAGTSRSIHYAVKERP